MTQPYRLAIALLPISSILLGCARVDGVGRAIVSSGWEPIPSTSMTGDPFLASALNEESGTTYASTRDVKSADESESGSRPRIYRTASPGMGSVPAEISDDTAATFADNRMADSSTKSTESPWSTSTASDRQTLPAGSWEPMESEAASATTQRVWRPTESGDSFEVDVRSQTPAAD